MPTHTNASEESQRLCADLVEELRKTLPDVTTRRAKNTCAIYVPGRNAFAHVYHFSRKGSTKIYVRGDPSVAPSLPKQLQVQVRPTVEKGYDKEFPLFF
jgi:hypothetical protein